MSWIKFWDLYKRVSGPELKNNTTVLNRLEIELSNWARDMTRITPGYNSENVYEPSTFPNTVLALYGYLCAFHSVHGLKKLGELHSFSTEVQELSNAKASVAFFNSSKRNTVVEEVAYSSLR